MSDFAGFVCWTRENVLQTIATEAVSPSDSVFAATHAPLDIRRVTTAGAAVDDRELISEPDLLAEFLERPTNHGVLVVPVLGASGAGKSHLVRWVHAHVPEAPGRQVIYLPKESTSLAGVIDRLLLGLEGPLFDDIRRDVGRLGRDITQESLERRLLDELAESLRVAAHTSPQERALVGERGLYLLLHDPFFRAQLLHPDSLIPRRADHAISGRGADDSDVPLQFTEADLPSEVLDVTQAGVASQHLFQNLVANHALKASAVELLNRHLDIAVMKAANLGVGRLHEAFLAIRRALAEDGQEIVLLVEDFALVQGIQRDLLDAILETGERAGQTVLAPIRTLLAVTTGYYGSLPETVQTRIESSSPFRYELRVTLGRGREHSVETEQRIVDFVGRYLNAARIGRNKLDELHLADSGVTPNKCESCPVREPCHTGFGTASTGHGLYPYNHAALMRAVRATAPGDEPDAFNPRAVLARAVRHVLTEYADDIKTRDFPSERFSADFPPHRDERVLSPAVSEQAMQAGEGTRRRVLLEFWAGAPAEFGNVAPEIHTAFGIPLASGAPRVEREDLPDEPTISPRPARRGTSSDALPPSALKRLRAIGDWNGRNAVLPQDVANEIRKTVHAAVISRVSWTDPATRQPTAAAITKAWPATAVTISIEDARENIAKTVTPAIRFGRTPENARFFEDIIRMREGVAEGTLQARLRLDRLGDLYAPLAKQSVLESTYRTDNLLLEALRVSLMGAATCGIAAPGDKAAALLNAVLWNAEHSRADQALRCELWRRTEERHLAHRAGLVSEIRSALGASQGAGEVSTIEATRALALVKQAAKSWEWKAEASRPDWAGQAAASLATLSGAVDQQLALLTELVADIRQRLPRGTGFAETAKSVQQAIEAGEHHGYVRHEDVPSLKQRNAMATATCNSRDLEFLEYDLNSVSDGAKDEQRLAVAARDRGPGLAVMRDFLVENERWLDAGLERTEAAAGQDAAELITRLTAVIKRWREAANDDGEV